MISKDPFYTKYFTLTWVLCLRSLRALNNRTYLLSHSILLTFVVLKSRRYLRTTFSKRTSSFLGYDHPVPLPGVD